MSSLKSFNVNNYNIGATCYFGFVPEQVLNFKSVSHSVKLISVQGLDN